MNEDTDLWKLPKSVRKMAGKQISKLEERISYRRNDLWRAQNEVKACEFDIARLQKELTNLKKKYNIPA